ncbi:glycoside hydrolase family 73 protein [Paenibacillus turpanensis]|uniref:glycoside hydrolase family 73 protein n=1 Tax=Paenibacillus turpanensis TaxID=2689078 RepID=UPI00140D1965|nr:glucosaminidase domain-containing protein [Paenibacillus turpanensis]
MTRDEFISIVAPIAVELRLEGSPVYPSVRIAQSVLETGGKIQPWNNLVGLKVGSGTPNPYWDGSYVDYSTWEVVDGGRNVNVRANFRAYNSIEDGYRDQDLFLTMNRRYIPVQQAQNPQAQAAAFESSGYATDPQYAEKLISIMNQYNLFRFDREVEAVLEQLRAQIEQLQQQQAQLTEQLRQLNAALTVEGIPDWAQEAVQAAVNKGVLNTPEGGSYDFYRMITILHRLGLFS